MIRRTLHGLWARKQRVLGTATAIVLGVGFLAATLVLGSTLDSSFGSLFERANAGTSVIVRSATSLNTDQGRERAPLDASQAALIAQVPGVAKVAPEVSGTAQILSRDGEPIGGKGPPTDAANWVDDAKLNPYRVVQGVAPARSGEAVIDASSASTGNLHVGDTVTIRTPEAVKLKLVGIVGFGDATGADAEGMGGATFVGLTDAQAIDLFGTPGKVSDLRVRGDGTRSDADLRAAVADVIPVRAEALTGAQLTAEQRHDIEGDFLGFVKTFLLAFAGVALVVATFSISNTFTILSAQRSRESALLRAIGATRGQVLGGALLEAMVIGAVASVIGVAVGLGLALGLKALLASFGLDLPGSGLVIESSAVVISLAVGLIVTMIAAAVPAIRSSRIAPIEALRDAAAEPTTVSRVRTAMGMVAGLLGAVVIVTATSSPDGAMARAGLGSLLVFVAAILLGPAFARPAAAAVGAPVAAGRGLVGQLARRNAMRNPRRTAGSALALVIGAAVVALFATFGSSVSHSIDQTVQRSFGGDLVVTQDSFSGAGLSPELAPAIAALPQVDKTVALDNVTARINGTTEFPTAGDPKAMASLLDLDVQRGSLADLRPGQVAITAAWAKDHEVSMGDPVTMTFADGKRATYHVAAVYGVGELLGDIVMTDQDWTPHALHPGNVAVLIGLAPGTSLDQGRAAVERVAEQHGSPSVEDRSQYIDRVAGQVNQLLTLVYGLLVLAILIALIGLANTLSLSIHERTRELGLLRAVGLTRGKLRAMVRWESMITAVVGTVLGLAMGTFLAWGLVRALSAQEGFVSFQLPSTTLVVVLFLAIGAGVLAAVRPAHRAARLDVLAAIAER